MMTQIQKLTEDETIDILVEYLGKNGWYDFKTCRGQERGIDITASKANELLLVEVKGARAGDKSPTKKRTHFDSGQIKTHFGRALVKVLEDRIKFPNAIVAIAHPNDIDIRRIIGPLIPAVKQMGIKHFWVSDSRVEEE